MHVLTREDFGLPVERQVIAVFANQHVGQKPRPGAAALNRARRKRRLRERFTAGAGHARADDPAHDKASGDILQLFGNILTDLTQGAAAVVAILTGGQKSCRSRWSGSGARLCLRLARGGVNGGAILGHGSGAVVVSRAA